VAKGDESPQNVQVAAKSRTSSAAAVSRGGADPGKKLNILVVEDDFLSRQTLISMLKPLGTCDVAFNGKEAVEAFATAIDDHPYDLVCMDIMMPEVDGFEAVKQIRSAEMLAAIKKLKESGAKEDFHELKDAVVIMTSALDDPDNYINACYRCGANAYLVKPIHQETLLNALARFGLAQKRDQTSSSL
jgi:two-component system chemotaxis response regulator CheY